MMKLWVIEGHDMNDEDQKRNARGWLSGSVCDADRLRGAVAAAPSSDLEGPMKYALLVMLFAGPLWAQEITMPEKVEARTNRLATIPIKSTVKSMRWVLVPNTDVEVFREHNPDPSIIRLRIVPYKDGQYSLICAGLVGEKVEIAVCTITATGGNSASTIAILPSTDKSEPRVISLGFAALARNELAKLTPEARKLASAIADNYEAIAAKTAASTGMTIAQMQIELDAKNQATLGALDRIAWGSWFATWKAEADRLSAAGQLTTIDSWAAIYRDTAIGLRK